MLTRLGELTWNRYVHCTPARIMPRIGFVTLLAAAATLVTAFLLPMNLDGDL